MAAACVGKAAVFGRASEVCRTPWPGAEQMWCGEALEPEPAPWQDSLCRMAYIQSLAQHRTAPQAGGGTALDHLGDVLTLHTWNKERRGEGRGGGRAAGTNSNSG